MKEPWIDEAFPVFPKRCEISVVNRPSEPLENHPNFNWLWVIHGDTWLYYVLLLSLLGLTIDSWMLLARGIGIGSHQQYLIYWLQPIKLYIYIMYIYIYISLLQGYHGIPINLNWYGMRKTGWPRLTATASPGAFGCPRQLGRGQPSATVGTCNIKQGIILCGKSYH